MTTYASPRRHRLLRAAATAVLAASAAAGAVVSQPAAPAAQAATDTGWFKPATTYVGEFADPDVLKVGSTYYAYGTNTGGSYLPVMHSVDTKSWIARRAYGATGDPLPNKGINPRTGTYYPGLRKVYNGTLRVDPYYNDALPDVAAWADRSRCKAHSDGTSAAEDKWCVGAWAPTVERLKDGRYLLAYVAQQSYATGRQCISLATATSPEGPFVDRTTKPVVCSSDPHGSIDPDLFRDPKTSQLHLIFKNEGVPGSKPTEILSIPINEAGTFQDAATSYVPGVSSALLLRTSQTWEGTLVENPSMVYWGGRYFLFHSGNLWQTASYATGETHCASPRSTCGRIFTYPVLKTSSTQGIWGPGGASAFVDPSGKLALLYAAWNKSTTGYAYANRIYHTARMTYADSQGRVTVANALG
ncbi:family 43 glycosylhydrolase [Arsenicicoccus dermatophilus]|uniref:family 43 glycosylhydrolase n=1 Tax=Arsenicicoccus dermatophilus TaxID=1076331 RepID=UPI0039171151